MIKKRWILLSIFFGGVLGTLLRYTINLQTITMLFPLGTMIENLVGSLLLGVLSGWVAIKAISPILKEGLGVGFCGGFTTMSTLAADSLFIAEGISAVYAGLYIVGSLFGGITLALVGIALGQRVALSQMKVGGKA